MYRVHLLAWTSRDTHVQDGTDSKNTVSDQGSIGCGYLCVRIIVCFHPRFENTVHLLEYERTYMQAVTERRSDVEA